MPPRTRATAPNGRVYKSTPLQEQVKFRPRKKLITYRHSTGNTTLSRQETLTQMDFVNLQLPISDDQENEDPGYEAQEKKRTRKRRRTDGDGRGDSHHTQTLTQLDFVSTPASRLESSQAENEEEPSVTEIIAEGQSKQQLTGPPRTPTRRRIFEIPSSQSPADSPFSVRSITTLDESSPLKERSLNSLLDFPLGQPELRLPITSIHKTPRLEIEDTFECSDESPQTRIPLTPAKKSSAIKSVRFAINSPPELSPSETDVREIEDSEAESEDGESCYGELGPETQMELEQIVMSSSEMQPPSIKLGETQDEESTQSLPSQKPQPSQYMESQFTQGQRLSTQQIYSMAPRSPRSDIFISIHPDTMEGIVDRVRYHDFRSFRLPDTVCRLWFYEKDPKSRVKYMASISGAKKPNDTDSSKRSSNFAYEILQIYELADPLPLKVLKANAWMEAPPTKYSFVRPAVLDALMANLRDPLFSDGASLPISSQDVPSTPLPQSDSQQAEAQLQCTMQQFTQLQSSQMQFGLPRPSQATTVDLTQVPILDVDVEIERDQSVIPESPSHLHLPISSPILPQINFSGATPVFQIPFSMSSSQLLTRSQLLPDSLLDDSIPPPPGFVDDSEEDDDDDEL